jgi:hypothetical protein
MMGLLTLGGTASNGEAVLRKDPPHPLTALRMTDSASQVICNVKTIRSMKPRADALHKPRVKGSGLKALKVRSLSGG